MTVITILKYIHLAVAVGLVVTILLQNRGSSMGVVFGGGGGSTFRSRRGVEAILFNATVILGLVFAINALIIAILNARPVV